MSSVLMEIPNVPVGKFLVPFDNQKVLGVFVLSCRREVKAAGNQCSSVNHDYLVVGVGMFVVDQDRYVGVGKERSCAVLGSCVRLVQDGLYLHAALPGVEKGLGNGLVCEAVSLNKDFLLGLADLCDNCFSCRYPTLMISNADASLT